MSDKVYAAHRKGGNKKPKPLKAGSQAEPTLDQSFYTISELANLSGIARQRMARLLKSLPIWDKSKMPVGVRIFFISDIKEELPELWEGISEAYHCRQLQKTMEQK